MSKIEWDKNGERFFETGVDHGVLYVWDDEKNAYGTGVAWNGLTSVSESPEGAEETEFWADNIKYAGIRSAETFGGTIECYTIPPEFYPCDGIQAPVKGMNIGQQRRRMFGFVYRTLRQNDTNTDADDSYLLHIWYGCTANPSEKAYETVNDSPDAVTFSYEVSSNPVNVTGFKPTSCITLDSKELSKEQLAAVEKVLYGDEGTDPTLPLPDQLKLTIESADPD